MLTFFDPSPWNAENSLKLAEKNKWILDERGISKESEFPEQITAQGAWQGVAHFSFRLLFLPHFFFTKVKWFWEKTSKNILKITANSVDIEKSCVENIFQAGLNSVLAATLTFLLSFLYVSDSISPIAQNCIWEWFCLCLIFPFLFPFKFNNTLLSNLSSGTF